MRPLLFLCLAGALALTACGDDDGPVPILDGGSDAGCVSGRTRCGSVCVDSNTDPYHCGRCSNECATTQTCAAGTCQASMECPTEGEIDCGGSCVDAQTSDLHCGRCGNDCNVNQTCMGGSCVLRDCPGTEMRCGTACVDVQADEANCGMCGMRCSDGQTCRSGKCEARCDTGEVECSVDEMSRCANLATDEENCGSCGNVCIGGRECVDMACECPTGRMLCGRACVDLQSDPANCGGCADRCASGIMCVSGSCECDGGLELCGVTCRNTQIDEDNCGTCGRACTATQTCVGGMCMSSCGTGTTMCGSLCVDLDEDPMNCGACGTRCGSGAACITGICRPENDDRADATVLTLGDAEVTVTGTTTRATRDGETVPCGCTWGGNVWYQFTLAAEAIVYFDTAGSAIDDTSLWITDATGTPVPGQDASGFRQAGLCNDDARCPTVGGTGWSDSFQSWTAGTLAAGTYYVAVSGCDAGDFTLHAQRFLRSASFWYAARLNGAGTTGSTSLVGSSATAGSCEVPRGTTSGEDMRWFLTCGENPQFFSLCPSDGGTWEHQDGSTTYDPVMYMRSAMSGAEVECNDDGAGTGSDCSGTGSSGTSPGWGSRIPNVDAPRGLNAVFIDSATGGAGMTYRMSYNTR